MFNWLSGRIKGAIQHWTLKMNRPILTECCMNIMNDTEETLTITENLWITINIQSVPSQCCISSVSVSSFERLRKSIHLLKNTEKTLSKYWHRTDKAFSVWRQSADAIHRKILGKSWKPISDWQPIKERNYENTHLIPCAKKVILLPFSTIQYIWRSDFLEAQALKRWKNSKQDETDFFLLKILFIYVHEESLLNSLWFIF